MNEDKMIPLKDKIAAVKVICLGDVMLDIFTYGKVHRISPESPVPVLAKTSEIQSLGGAGNVAHNIVALGASCTFLTVTGNDETADALETLLSHYGNLNYNLLRDKTRVTTSKNRFVADGQQLLRVDHEAINPLSIELKKQIIKNFEFACLQCDVVVLSDYAKGFFSQDLIQNLIQFANDHSKPVLIDPKGRDYKRYKGAFMLTPNLKELSEAIGTTLRTTEEIIQAARQIMAECSINAILVTCGADGMVLVESHKDCAIDTLAQEIFDVSGAGDTVMATLAVGLASGLDLEAASRLSNKAAGVAVGKIGTVAVTLDEILANEDKNDEMNARHIVSKIMNKTELLIQVQAWRQQGLKIGFTNGCFDLIHKGHLHILSQSANLCDCLVVGINNDDSVKRLKGDQRPIQDESTRSNILAAIESVDAVCLFEDETPLDLIQMITPDVLIKGADYKIENVVGASHVTANGGEVRLIDLVLGESTTNTISRIKLT